MPSPPISRELWRRVEPVFERALELPEAERPRYLDAACAGDAEARRAAEQFLATSDGLGDFLSGNALDVLAGLPARAEALPDAPPMAGRHAGPYLLLREVGRGGMGAVYEAVRDDGQFRLRAALKLAPPGAAGDPRLRERLLAERRVLARLEHPHIARLFDGGWTDDGAPWFAMEFVEGKPIVAWCDAQGLLPHARLGLFVQVCDAVAHAHRAGIVHRDIKPSNILITRDGEAKLVDFGIAKLLAPEGEERTSAPLTRTGPAPLTPEYASPEQLRGEPATLASDVYALGVVLHELLTGHRPGGYRDPETGAPRSRIRGGLGTIVQVALRREPARRYRDAGALAADLRRHLEGAPLVARPDGITRRLGKLARRHALVATTAALLLALAALGLTLTRGQPGGPTGSPRALFEAGLRAANQLQPGLAAQLFDAALARDSTFALAAYHRALVEPDIPSRHRLLDAAHRLAVHAPAWERRFIEQRWVATFGSWEVSLERATALASLHPDRAEAQQALGEARYRAGRHAEAIEPLERAIRLDAAALPDGGELCVACLAYRTLVDAYLSIDSAPAAERIARRWIAQSPRAARAWFGLAVALDVQGQPDASLAAGRNALEGPPGETMVIIAASPLVRAGRFAEVDRYLADQVRLGSDRVRAQALELLATSRRYQGRLNEALATARAFRAAELEDRFEAAYLEAQVLYELGRYPESAALFDSVAGAVYRGDPAPAHRARTLAWNLTHVAEALAAMGDTLALARLADSVAVLGSRSQLGRDARLAHHIRGLRHRLGGRDGEAIAEFRRAIFSPTIGYTRTSLELGRLLLATGDPEGAVAVLGPALRGGIHASNTYVTQTEIHELLGAAFDAAGRPDSARVHLARAAAAWRGGDPPFAARAATAQARLAALAEDASRP
jgi:tetratricopeptide (TPR) repeat protein